MSVQINAWKDKYGLSSPQCNLQVPKALQPFRCTSTRASFYCLFKHLTVSLCIFKVKKLFSKCVMHGSRPANCNDQRALKCNINTNKTSWVSDSDRPSQVDDECFCVKSKLKLKPCWRARQFLILISCIFSIHFNWLDWFNSAHLPHLFW